MADLLPLLSNYLYNLLSLSLDAAPWLVLGLVLGGLIHSLIPTDFLHRHLQGHGIGSIAKATLLGAPLPLCSCGVIPAAKGLRDAGASKPATAAFLVSTPETGVDSVAITYAMMGPFIAVVRPIAAIASAFITGLLVAWGERSSLASHASEQSSPANDCTNSSSACCGTASNTSSCTKQTTTTTTSACCHTANTPHAPDASQWWHKMGNGLHYAFGKLLNTIVLWLAVGLLFAAFVQTFIPTDFLTQWGGGLLAMLVMVLIGIPMYICATASTPLAVGFMLAGLSPGAALVFLMTGPATNISTLGVIRQSMGNRTLVLYLIGVIGTSVMTGLIVNDLVDRWNVSVTTILHAHQHTGDHAIAWISLAILIIAVIGYRFQKR